MVQADNSNAVDAGAPSDYGFDDSVAERVVTSVAEATDQSPLEMDPISTVVDPDAIDALVRGPDDQGSSVVVEFTYCGQHVTVTADDVRLDQADSTAE
jgi:hypothetical protein